MIVGSSWYGGGSYVYVRDGSFSQALWVSRRLDPQEGSRWSPFMLRITSYDVSKAAVMGGAPSVPKCYTNHLYHVMVTTSGG